MFARGRPLGPGAGAVRGKGGALGITVGISEGTRNARFRVLKVDGAEFVDG